MTFPVLVQPENGEFAAALVGAPDIRATAATRSGAVAALEAAIANGSPARVADTRDWTAGSVCPGRQIS